MSCKHIFFSIVINEYLKLYQNVEDIIFLSIQLFLKTHFYKNSSYALRVLSNLILLY